MVAVKASTSFWVKTMVRISLGVFTLLGSACSLRLPTDVSEQPAGTASEAPSEASLDWIRYADSDHGFSFEYPAAYESSAQQSDCGMRRSASPGGTTLHWGARSSLTVLTATTPPERFLRDHLQNRTEDLHLAPSIVANSPAIHATYRFGGTGRFGEAYAFEHRGELYVAEMTAGAFCEIPNSPAFEPAVFQHVIETFQFDS